MKRRQWIGLIASLFLYGIASYIVLVHVPRLVVPSETFGEIDNQVELVANTRSAVRTNAVTLLTGSAIGITGVVAIFSISAARRSEDGALRAAQDELMAKSVEALGTGSVPAKLSAVQSLVSLNADRRDLRGAMQAALFGYLRCSRVVDGRLDASPDGRSCGDLIDRDPVSDSAIRAIGQLTFDISQSTGFTHVVDRRLDRCDFRRSLLVNGRYELCNFTESYFWDSKIVDCTFVKCTFNFAEFLGAHTSRVRFMECDLRYVDLTPLQDATFDNCKTS